MFPASEAFLHERVPQPDWRGDEDRVEGGIVDEFLVRAVRESEMVFGGEGVGAVFRRRGDGVQGDAGMGVCGLDYCFWTLLSIRA